MWVYLNGEFVERAQARVSVFDHGFLYGDGVYETLRVYKGKILLWERHFARLRQSCDRIDLHLPFPEKEWESIFGELLVRNNLLDAGLRITLSRGEGEIGIDPNLCHHPTIVVMAKPIHAYTEYQRKEGLVLHVASVRRNPEICQPPQIKAMSFLNNILAKQEAVRVGADEALMLNLDGHLAECTTSNFFFVKNLQLHTPAVECGILKGVTRDVVIELAEEHGLVVHEGCYAVEQALHADECFITNTGLEIMPVSKIGNSPIGEEKRGPVTNKLWKAFQSSLNKYLGPNLIVLAPNKEASEERENQ